MVASWPFPRCHMALTQATIAAAIATVRCPPPPRVISCSAAAQPLAVAALAAVRTSVLLAPLPPVVERGAMAPRSPGMPTQRPSAAAPRSAARRWRHARTYARPEAPLEGPAPAPRCSLAAAAPPPWQSGCASWMDQLRKPPVRQTTFRNVFR